MALMILTHKQPLFTRQMCKGITVQGATSLLAGLALVLTPLPLLLYMHGAKLRESVRQKKEAAAAMQAANQAAAGGNTIPKEPEKALAVGARIPPGGAVESMTSSSMDASLTPSDDVSCPCRQ